MALPPWKPKHPEGKVFMRNRPDLVQKLNCALPQLREMDMDGLWATLPGNNVMDGTHLDKCKACETSAEQIERIVKFLKQDQVWKFHAFLKTLYEIKQGHYIDIVLGDGASQTYATQFPENSAAGQVYDQGTVGPCLAATATGQTHHQSAAGSCLAASAGVGATGSSMKRFTGLERLHAQDYKWIDKRFDNLKRECGWVERPVGVAIVDIIINKAHLTRPKNVEIVNCAKKLPPNMEYLEEGEGDPDKYAENPHGTICAGIIEKHTPRRTKIVAYNVGEYDEENKIWIYSDSAIIKALKHIEERTDIDVVSMSFGGETEDERVTDILKRLSPKKIHVAGASNEGRREANTIQYPAKLDDVMAVGSCDQDGEKAGHSAVGEELDFLMPGLGVEFSRWRKDGTSFATPHLAAATVLILTAIESTQDDGVETRKQFTATQVMKKLLIRACNDRGNHTIERGYGLPNLNLIKQDFLEEYIQTLQKDHDQTLLNEQNDNVQNAK